MTTGSPDRPAGDDHPLDQQPLDRALRAGESALAAAGITSARADVELLAAHLLGVSRGELAALTVLGRPAPDGLAALVAERARRVPLQHLTGTAAFRGLELAVGPGVFVPRPETEQVAQAAIDAAVAVVAARGAAVVVDLCTGSGAIALAVAHEVPDAVVHAVELDAAAHTWATRNLTPPPTPPSLASEQLPASALSSSDASGATDAGGATGAWGATGASGASGASEQGRVRLVRGDARTALGELDGAVDVVVSNPPYIPPDAVPVDPEVRDHDPDVALYGLGPDGLTVPRGVVEAAARLLRPGGVLVMEHAETQAGAVRELVRATGAFEQVATRQDLAGRDRMVVAIRVAVAGGAA